MTVVGAAEFNVRSPSGVWKRIEWRSRGAKICCREAGMLLPCGWTYLRVATCLQLV